MRGVLTAVALLSTALGSTPNIAAQALPPGGYFADGAYYVPGDVPGSAPALGSPSWPTNRQAESTSRPEACPSGQYWTRQSVPTVYVAQSATMIRIYQFWPFGGDGSAPGFPYVPVYDGWC